MNRQTVIAGIAFGLLGFASNWFKLELFFNLDFLFGTFWVMLCIFFYGARAGALAGLIAGTCTYLLWHHPWAIIIQLAEAVFVGWIFNKRKNQAITADILYWFAIGMPLVLLFYRVVMAIPCQTTFMVMLKQSINGILNTIVATIVYLAFLLWRKEQDRLPSFRQLLFVAMLSFALFPAFTVFVFHLKSYMRAEQQRLIHDTAQTAELARHLLEGWVQQQNATPVKPNRAESEQNQSLERNTSFQALGVVNEQRFWPTFLNGNSEFEQREVCADPSSRSAMKKKLKDIIGSQPLDITLLDTRRVVVVTTRTNLAEGAHIDVPAEGERHTETDGVYHYIPKAPKGSSIMQRWRQSLFIKEESFENSLGLNIRVEASLQPMLDKLGAETIKVLTSMLLLALAVVAASSLISKRFVGSLQALRDITKEIPLEFQGTVVERAWPDSRTKEVSELTRNFKQTVRALHQSFDALKSSYLYQQAALLKEVQHHHEKERLIKDIHDGVGGIVTNIVMLGQYGSTHTDIKKCQETLHKITELATEGTEEIRSFMNSIESGVSAWSDLLAELKNYAEKMFEPHSIKLTVIKDINIDAPEVKTFRYVNIVRIFREGITNIVKHAHAHHVKLVFIVDQQQCMVSLEDDGVGCDISMLRKRGLASMKSRAKSISADISLTASPGNGTIIRLSLPLIEPKQQEPACT